MRRPQKFEKNLPLFLKNKFVTFSEYLNFVYFHFSNNRGGWNKRVGVQKLQNQLDFSPQFFS
jgi:hypothetical protein